MSYKYPECKDCDMTKESLGRDRCNTPRCPAKSRAESMIRGELVALKEQCSKCEEKNCSLSCPVKRRRDIYERLQREGGRRW